MVCVVGVLCVSRVLNKPLSLSLLELEATLWLIVLVTRIATRQRQIGTTTQRQCIGGDGNMKVNLLWCVTTLRLCGWQVL